MYDNALIAVASVSAVLWTGGLIVRQLERNPTPLPHNFSQIAIEYLAFSVFCAACRAYDGTARSSDNGDSNRFFIPLGNDIRDYLAQEVRRTQQRRFARPAIRAMLHRLADANALCRNICRFVTIEAYRVMGQHHPGILRLSMHYESLDYHSLSRLADSASDRVTATATDGLG